MTQAAEARTSAILDAQKISASHDISSWARSPQERKLFLSRVIPLPDVFLPSPPDGVTDGRVEEQFNNRR